VAVPATLPPGQPAPLEPVEIDTSVAHASRMYDYLLGGSNNFAVDREIAERMAEAFYGGLDIARADVRANRDFLVRVVRYLVADAGVRQFLDVGTGIPNGDNVHAVAQELAPETRVVYVDYDRIVQAYARTLLQSTPEGATDFVVADLREPERIVEEARATLDFDQPIALVLVSVLHNVPEDAHAIVGRLLEALPPGSFLVISHLASDIHAEEIAEAVTLLTESSYEVFVARDRAAVARFFEGLELLEPGVVPVDQWRPSGTGPPARSSAKSNGSRSRPTPVYGAVGRKA
jgi:hypothetical protein